MDSEVKELVSAEGVWGSRRGENSDAWSTRGGSVSVDVTERSVALKLTSESPSSNAADRS